MRLKSTSKGKKVTYSLICVFMLFMCFLCFFVCNTKKGSIFMRIKTSQRKKIACLTFSTFCAFYAFYGFYERKKRLSESRLFTFCAFCAFLCFLCFLCFFVLFVRVKSFRKKKKQTALIPSFILLFLPCTHWVEHAENNGSLKKIE